MTNELFHVFQLTDSASDLELLENVYNKHYCQMFPVQDERESLEYFSDSLRNACGNASGRFHFGIAVSNSVKPSFASCDDVCGFIAGDYLAVANSSIIEFLGVRPDKRNMGIGQSLVNWLKIKCSADSHAYNGPNKEGLTHIYAEVSTLGPKSKRLNNQNGALSWWRNRGFKRLDFSYIQPAISIGRLPVSHLALMVKPISNKSNSSSIKTSIVKEFILNYSSFAFGMDVPRQDPVVAQMIAELETKTEIPLI